MKKRSFILNRLPLVAALYAAAGGAISLAGWIFALPRLTDWENDGIQIKANATICVLMAGTGLLIAILFPTWKRFVRLLAVGVTAIAALTLLQHLTGLNFGIDTLLFEDAPNARATVSPGRMGVPASSSLTCIGIALAFLSSDTKYHRPASILGVVSLIVASLSLAGYLFGANQLYSIPAYTGIALQTAMFIAALGVGLVAAIPDYGLVRALSRDDAGGVLLRRLVIPVIAVSFVLGYIRVLGQNAGLYDTAFGTALRTLLEILLLLGILWWTANDISRMDARARLASEAVADREERLSSVLESLTDMFMSFDADLRFNYLNASAKRLFAYQGFSETNFIGEFVFDVFPPARETELGELLKQVLEDRKPREVEAYYPPFDRHFYTRYFPLDDGGVSVFALDVTPRKRAEQLAERRFSELASLYNLAERLNHCVSLTDVYEAALKSITEVLECERASILFYDESGIMQFAAARGLSEEYQKAVTGHSPWKQGDKGARPIGVYDIDLADESEELKEVIRREGIQSLGFIPLVSDEILIGKFTFYYGEPHQFTDAEFEIAMTIGQQIASAVEQKRTGKELSENEERLRLATQTGKVGVWDWDIHANSVSWTDAVYTMHGVAQGEFDGSVESFSALVHPEDRAAVGAAIEMALAGEAEYEIEFRVPRTDGETNWLYTNARVLRDASGPYRMIGATIDITDRKVAELESAKLATIVQSSLDAIISIDLDGVITSWNRGAEKLYGYVPSEIINESVMALVPAERADEESAILSRINQGETVEPYETVRRHSDGSLIDISLTVSPLLDGDGRIIGASKIARDITVRKQAEVALRESEIMRRLVDAQEAERHRIARDLHDHLGQQLTALRLKLESVRGMSTGHSEIENEIKAIQQQAARIDVDINYLAWELRPTELDSLGLTDALASFVREWSNTYGIVADFHATESQNGRLHPELETNLYRIVQEGLNNILKHAKAENVNVLLELRNTRVDLIIEDDGTGFEAESRPKHGGKRDGLGLVGMRERAALLGGTLEIESRVGGGTTVFARVPRRAGEIDANSTEKSH